MDFEQLKKLKVIVRPMDPYGLPNHIRITSGTPRKISGCWKH